MIRIPKTKAQLLTTLAGVAIAALGYYFPAFLPYFLAFLAGAGAVQVGKKAES